MTWYRGASITGGPPPVIAAMDEDTLEPESEGAKRAWWRRKHSRSRSAGSVGTDGGGSGGGNKPQPSSPSLALHHYPDWAAFWDRQCVCSPAVCVCSNCACSGLQAVVLVCERHQALLPADPLLDPLALTHD